MRPGEQVVLFDGWDFVSSPRLSPDGGTLAWLSWDHPNMPWDGTHLWTAPVRDDGTLGEATLVAGGEHVSVFQPEWSPDGVLHYVSEESGWWNLYRLRRRRAGGSAPRRRRVRPSAVDFRQPHLRVRRQRGHRVRGEPARRVVAEPLESRQRHHAGVERAGRRDGTGRSGGVRRHGGGGRRRCRASHVADAGEPEQWLLGHAEGCVEHQC